MLSRRFVLWSAVIFDAFRRTAVAETPAREPRVVEDSGTIRYNARPSTQPVDKVARYLWDRFSYSSTPVRSIVRLIEGYSQSEPPMWNITLQDGELGWPYQIVIDEKTKREFSVSTDSNYTIPLSDEADTNLHTGGFPSKFSRHLHAAPYEGNPNRIVVGFVVDKGILSEREWLLRLQAFCEQRL